MKVVALAGGGGAAKFLRGLLRAHPAKQVTIIGNTGDDAKIHGLHVSPDLDIVLYALAGFLGERGWGLRNDTTHALDQMRIYGAPTWFNLGDRDLGTHLARTQWLSEGVSLTEITDRIRLALGVEAKVIPMSDQRVSTKLTTSEGYERDFQEYFVKFGHSEDIAAVEFEGAESSVPAAGVLEAMGAADRIIICPSNPLLSISPILAVPGIRAQMAARRDRVFAISPIVQGAALKGPAGRLLPVWGAEPSASGVAGLYSDICQNFVLDRLDSEEAGKITSLGLEALIVNTMMKNDAVAAGMAEAILSFPLRPASR